MVVSVGDVRCNANVSDCTVDPSVRRGEPVNAFSDAKGFRRQAKRFFVTQAALKRWACPVVMQFLEMSCAVLLVAVLASHARAEPARETAPSIPAAWTTPVRPFRVAGNIYYVGTRGLSAWLLTSRDGAILLDGTLALNAGLVERNIESLGVPLARVKLLIADHAHYDHVGALAQLRHDTGARLLASEGDRQALEEGRPRGDTDYRPIAWPAVHVDGIVHDGETIRLGDIALTAHLTPGHTPGCTSWTETVQQGGRPLRVIFLCSITVAGNLLVNNRAYPGIADDFRASFRRLAAMHADIVLTSHPDIANVMGRAARRAAGDANAFIDAGALPAIVAHASATFEKAYAEQNGRPEKKSP
jgi:metallo-beta-lactamase class B